MLSSYVVFTVKVLFYMHLITVQVILVPLLTVIEDVIGKTFVYKLR